MALAARTRGIADARGIAVLLREGGSWRRVAEEGEVPPEGVPHPADFIPACSAILDRGETLRNADAAGTSPDACPPTVAVPIGHPYAEAAICAWWPRHAVICPAPVARIEALARLAAIAIDNVRAKTDRARMESELRLVAETLEQRVEERTRELDEAQEALRQSQKLEAMGQLTGGVAHDFNNLLTPIVGTLDLLHRRGIGNERERRLIEGARQSAERASTLVHRLLAFARRQPLTIEAVDLSALIAGLADLLSTTAGMTVALETDVDPDLPAVRVDAHQLEMAIFNLVVNARDAMPEGGCLAISARRGDGGAGRPASFPQGDCVVLSVADSGTGMPEDVVERAVEPFFSTKDVGRGTGLGLSMVHGLMSQLGGGLTLESRLGEGTTVRLWLPVAERPAAGGRAPDEPAPADAVFRRLRSGETVLLVDDEELVRASTADMLEEMGYEVLEAAAAEDALAMLDEDRRIDVLITDHLMPGMSGLDLARTARLRRPGLGILVVSGYSDLDGLASDMPRLQKPFLKSDLAERLCALKAPGSRSGA